MDKQTLHNFITEKASNIRAVVALKDGKTVYSDYWESFSKTDTLHVMSVTKSIVSLLVGIAIDKGLIRDLDCTAIEFFPNYTPKRGEKTIQQVTLRHLMTMTAPYKYKSEPWTKVCTSEDWTVAALDLLGGRAGITGEFIYSTLGIHILNGIITATSGMTTVEFANKYLFEPLGICEYINYEAKSAEEHREFILSKEPKGRIWFCDPKGVATAGYGLCISAVDMAKIGQLCLNGGVYNGKQIVSKSWIEESTAPRFKCDYRFANMTYGYLWWIINEAKHIYAAIGNSGNVIYINPNDNIVVSVMSTFKPTVFDRVLFIQKYIEPLAKSEPDQS